MVDGGKMKSEEQQEKQDSPEGTAVVLEEFHGGEENVWLTGEGKVLVVGVLGTLGGNESVSVASSSNGSG